MALEQSEQSGPATVRNDRFLAENHPPTPFVVFNDRIHYRVRTPFDGGACGHAILAGPPAIAPTFSIAPHPYELQLDLAIDAPVDFLSAGVYTTSVTAVTFNGFLPIRSYVI